MVKDKNKNELQEEQREKEFMDKARLLEEKSLINDVQSQKKHCLFIFCILAISGLRSFYMATIL